MLFFFIRFLFFHFGFLSFDPAKRLLRLLPLLFSLCFQHFFYKWTSNYILNFHKLTIFWACGVCMWFCAINNISRDWRERKTYTKLYVCARALAFSLLISLSLSSLNHFFFFKWIMLLSLECNWHLIPRNHHYCSVFVSILFYCLHFFHLYSSFISLLGWALFAIR